MHNMYCLYNDGLTEALGVGVVFSIVDVCQINIDMNAKAQCFF